MFQGDGTKSSQTAEQKKKKEGKSYLLASEGHWSIVPRPEGRLSGGSIGQMKAIWMLTSRSRADGRARLNVRVP